MRALIHVLRSLLALHTLSGALWKFGTVPSEGSASLAALPAPIWTGMGVLELAVAALLASAFSRRIPQPLALGALAFIAAEMLMMTAVNLASSSPDLGSATYWLVVTALTAFIAFGQRRWVAPSAA